MAMAMAGEALPAAVPKHHEDIDEEPSSLLRLRLQAMTWAAHAKDDSLHSLHSQLQSSLLLARSAHDKLAVALAHNSSLERQVEEGRAREHALELQIVDLTGRLEGVQAAEERLASEMGQIEAESLQQAIESSRLVSSLHDRLKEKERLLEEALREVRSRSDPEINVASQIAKMEQKSKMLEKKVAEEESARRKSEAERQQSEKKCAALQEKLEAAEARNRELEQLNKELIGKTRNSKEDKFVSVKLEDLGVKLRFWDAATLAAANQAAAPA